MAPGTGSFRRALRLRNFRANVLVPSCLAAGQPRLGGWRGVERGGIEHTMSAPHGLGRLANRSIRRCRQRCRQRTLTLVPNGKRAPHPPIWRRRRSFKATQITGRD